MTSAAAGEHTDVHPLLAYLLDAAAGRFPPVDGGVTHVPPLADGNRAVVAFTGHAVIASPFAAADVPGRGVEGRDITLDGFGGALQPEALLWLADGGSIGVNDVTLVAAGTDGPLLAPTDVHDDHPRVAHARRLRREVEVFGDERGFVTIASGLAGRREMSIELVDPGAEPGLGRELAAAARHHIGPAGHLFAAVSPGNARSLRAFLAAGYVPIGSEVIIAMSSSS